MPAVMKAVFAAMVSTASRLSGAIAGTPLPCPLAGRASGGARRSFRVPRRVSSPLALLASIEPPARGRVPVVQPPIEASRERELATSHPRRPAWPRRRPIGASERRPSPGVYPARHGPVSGRSEFRARQQPPAIGRERESPRDCWDPLRRGTSWAGPDRLFAWARTNTFWSCAASPWAGRC